MMDPIHPNPSEFAEGVRLASEDVSEEIKEWAFKAAAAFQKELRWPSG